MEIGKNLRKYTVNNSSNADAYNQLTRATTDMSSDHADASSTRDPSMRNLLTSSSPPTSLRTLFAASWASCFAAVVLTEVDEPVSRRIMSLSKREDITGEIR